MSGSSTLNAILYAKVLGSGGSGGEVTPQVLLDATAAMTLSEQAQMRANIGATDTTTGLADSIKQALLDCFAHVAWTDDQGQTYYDALQTAMYPLASITAVYTQGGTVYDTDSLDGLKADLVVTATYESGTTETVDAADYTLSGSLTTPGTNTITVSYGGKTTTFTVLVTEKPLPDGYTAYDYLKRSSASVDYVETTLTKSPSFAVLDCDFEFSMGTAATANGAIAGCRTTSATEANKNEYGVYACNQSKNAAIRSTIFGAPTQDCGDFIANTVRHVAYRFNSGNAYVTIDGGDPIYLTNSVTSENIPNQTTYPLFLCGINTGDYAPDGATVTNADLKCGRITFKDPQTGYYVYDFIPSYNGAKYGYCDRVSGTFYPQKNNVLTGGNF